MQRDILQKVLYKWILPKTDCEKESSKAAPYLLGSPAYPDNYIAAILEAEAKFKYVLIPSIGFLLSRLYEYYGISYLLCYPSIELKEEYRSRYASRGNTDDFTNVFIDQWDTRIRMLDNDENGIHFKLNSGQFLTDIKDALDSADDFARQIPIERNKEILELKKISDMKLRQGCVHLGGYASPSYYYCLDLRIDENKKWVYNLGKLCGERSILIETDEVQSLETFYDHMYGVDQDTMLRKLDSRQEVMRLIEEITETGKLKC